ncbi:MAG: HAMP domain-containing histidine kinase [Raineya sp.]|nr:HAMP domain-containing histidine kinase [Raineya sp.]
MQNRTIQILIVLTLIMLIGIGVAQFIWFRKAFDLKEKQFNHNVHLALRGVAERFFVFTNQAVPETSPVEQLSNNYFTVMLNAEIDVSLLEGLLITEFSKRNLSLDFEYGIYNCQNEQMIYGNFIEKENKFRTGKKTKELPKWDKDNYYFGIYFPKKNNELIAEMDFWLFSLIVLLALLGLLVYAISMILKQKRLSEVQKDFINNMAHEFKTPLATILVSSDLLKKPVIQKDTEATNRYLGLIQNETLRIKEQIERILQIAQFEKVELQITQLSFHELVEKVLNSLQLVFEQKEAQIILNLDAKQDKIEADNIHIESMLINLLENSLKYCDEKPIIQIQTSNTNQYLKISIVDNGIGIDKKHHKKVFEKFYRVHTGNLHNVKGFGLGLSYVEAVLKRHKGYFTLKSEKNKGATIDIFIPHV